MRSTLTIVAQFVRLLSKLGKAYKLNFGPKARIGQHLNDQKCRWYLVAYNSLPVGWVEYKENKTKLVSGLFAMSQMYYPLQTKNLVKARKATMCD